MNKNKNHLILFLAFLFSLVGFGNINEIPGTLVQLEASEGKLSYECSIRTRLKNADLKVSLQTQNAFIEATLDEGIRVKGFASETHDSKTGITYYYLQGGSAPYFQQLTLLVGENGNWAEFRKTYGGATFRCRIN